MFDQKERVKVLRIYRPFYRHLYIRYNSNAPSELLSSLNDIQSGIYKGLPFHYSFFDQKVNQIIKMILKRYFKWIIISFVIATPIAFYLTKMWLQGFAYGIKISPWTYLFSLISVIIIAFLTLGFLSRRSARANPAEILKYN